MLPLLPWLQPLNEEAAAADWLESKATVTEEEGLLVDEVSSDGNNCQQVVEPKRRHVLQAGRQQGGVEETRGVVVCCGVEWSRVEWWEL